MSEIFSLVFIKMKTTTWRRSSPGPAACQSQRPTCGTQNHRVREGSRIRGEPGPGSLKEDQRRAWVKYSGHLVLTGAGTLCLPEPPVDTNNPQIGDNHSHAEDPGLIQRNQTPGGREELRYQSRQGSQSLPGGAIVCLPLAIHLFSEGGDLINHQDGSWDISSAVCAFEILMSGSCVSRVRILSCRRKITEGSPSLWRVRGIWVRFGVLRTGNKKPVLRRTKSKGRGFGSGGVSGFSV